MTPSVAGSPLSVLHPAAVLGSQPAEPSFSGLYRLAGVAALLTFLFIPAQMAVFFVWPPPIGGTALDWFNLFQWNALVGLVDLDLLMVFEYALMIPIYLAAYLLLRHAAPQLSTLGATLGVVSAAVFFPSNPAFEMLSLSQGYAAATTDAQRSMFLAAGQASIVGWTGTAFNVSYVLASIAGVLVALAMLKGDLFSRNIAYLGLLTNVLGLGLFVPVVGIPLALFSVLFLWFWCLFLGRRLLQLAESASHGKETL